MATIEVKFGLARIDPERGTIRVPYTFFVKDYPNVGDRHEIFGGSYLYTPDWGSKTKPEMLNEIQTAITGLAQGIYTAWKAQYDLEFWKFVGYSVDVEVT